MDPKLLAQVMEATPDLNDSVARGLACEQMEDAERYIDDVFQSVANDFPEGLTYDGYERCTPEEELRQVTRQKDNKESYELAPSDLYMVKYAFSWKGEPLWPRYLRLPYVHDGGLIRMRGRRFAIHPVLADPGFSKKPRSMFISLNRTRLTFERQIHHFVANDERETVYVVWSWVHNEARSTHGSRGSKYKIYSTLAHYLFIHYGVQGALQEFAGADTVIGTDEQITRDHYPPDEWMICTTLGLKPQALARSHNYQYTNVRVAIRKADYNDNARNLIGTLFYLLDHFPHRIQAEYINNETLWKILLGHIIWSEGKNEGAILDDIDEHLISIDEFIDFMVIRDLRLAGIEVNNIYELFMHVIEDLTHTTVISESEVASMYGKRMVTLRYVLHDVTMMINKMYYDMRKMFKNAAKNGTELTADQIQDKLNQCLHPSRAIMAITNHARHPEVSSVLVSNDNMFFGVTSTVVSQEDAGNKSAGGRGSKEGLNLKDPTKHLHASQAEVASYNNLPKSDPTGRSRINPCLKLGPAAVIEPEPAKQDLIARTQRKLDQ